jgi:Predicted oxidoreductases (related to aryl-alcohol dehydrogenases)
MPMSNTSAPHRGSRGISGGYLIKKALGSGHLATDSQSQLRQLFQDPRITSAIIGTTNLEHLRHNCAAFDE